MRWIRGLEIALLFGIVSLIWAVEPAAAATINIDGNVSDWDKVPKVTTSSHAQVAMVVTNDKLYYYVAMNPTGLDRSNENGWEVQNTLNNPGSYTLEAANKTFTLTTNLRGTFPTSIGGKTAVNVDVYGPQGGFNNNGTSNGYVTAVKNSSQDGYQDVFEGQVSLLDLQLSDNDTTYNLSGGGYGLGRYSLSTTQTKTNDSATSGTTTDTSSSTGVVNSDVSDQKGDAGKTYDGHPDIVIDGQFDDWSKIPKTQIRVNTDDFNVKDGAMVQYDGNLYIYINMSPNRGTGYNALQPAGYDLTIGNKTYNLNVENSDGTKYTPLTTRGETRAITMGIWDGKQNKWTLIPAEAKGEASRIATDTGGYSDVFEMKIPLKDFDISGDDGQTITLQNRNLGTQTITVTGGSTGPVLLASTGFGLALFGAWKVSRRKRRNEEG